MSLEYRHGQADTNDFEPILNNAAQDGWRLHSWNIDADYPVTSAGYIQYILTRPIIVEQQPPLPRFSSAVQDLEDLLIKIARGSRR